ncbi:hypothetical protein [Thiomicrorhabdus sp.]|uniref:hypothetical protein n=1 Tax=Thiomicrorhabdus sp. TaxID=2039724 RepID=UPI0029C6A345|nr:hypothetical protein [Thiomicrorhabdus sp.]
MSTEKAMFTWHYYFMALGALLAMLAATLGAWGGIVSGLAFAIVSHPRLRFQGLGRFVFLVLFAVIYVFAFPDPAVVREMMAS